MAKRSKKHQDYLTRAKAEHMAYARRSVAEREERSEGRQVDMQALEDMIRPGSPQRPLKPPGRVSR